jgi:hypothetical protein
MPETTLDAIRSVLERHPEPRRIRIIAHPDAPNLGEIGVIAGEFGVGFKVDRFAPRDKVLVIDPEALRR